MNKKQTWTKLTYKDKLYKDIYSNEMVDLDLWCLPISKNCVFYIEKDVARNYIQLYLWANRYYGCISRRYATISSAKRAAEKLITEIQTLK